MISAGDHIPWGIKIMSSNDMTEAEHKERDLKLHEFHTVIAKLIAETTKMLDESAKLRSEGKRLAAEAIDRERDSTKMRIKSILCPLATASVVVAGVAAGTTLLLRAAGVF